MKLIIDISDEHYRNVCKRAEYFGKRNIMLAPHEKAIANGIPLSEELETILAEGAELSEQSGFVSVAELISQRIAELKGENK